MVTIKDKVSKVVDTTKKRIGLFKDVWTRRLNFVMSQLIAARLSIGDVHEGEAGLLIAKFIRETFRSVSIVRKIDKLSSTTLGKAFITKIILENIPKNKRQAVLEDIKKLANLDGLNFIEGVRKVMKNHLTSEEFQKVSRTLGNRLAYALVSENAIFDVIDQKLYAVDEVTGEVIEKKLDLRKTNDVIELLSYGVIDKKKDLYVDFAEWRMLRIIDEGMQKGLKGKSLGEYVYSRLRDELSNDPHLRESFKYYLIRYYDRLEKSKIVMAGFGELLIGLMRLQRRMIAAIARAASALPIFGPVAEAIVGMGESLGEIGEQIIEKSKSIKRTLRHEGTPSQ